MTRALADNPRTGTQAKVKKHSARARAAMDQLDARALADLEAVYLHTAAELEADILRYAGTDGSVPLDVLNDLLAQVNLRLDELAAARDALLVENLDQAAALGVMPFAVAAVAVGVNLPKVATEAAQRVRSVAAADGLTLSDRIWRINAGAREQLSLAIRISVTTGHSASRAANDFLAQGQSVPADLRAQLGQAQAGNVAKRAGAALLQDEGNARAKAMRVFRTEINRAHGEAYQAAAFEHPDVIGTRFLLSPRHPEHDICDMHASVNRYGLGPGVYPPGQNPWPAHPNTLSYTEVVFADEVTEADQAGKQDRIDWLNQQPAAVQESVLNSRGKRAALHQGVLVENEIATPWKVLKNRYSDAGIKIEVDDANSPSDQ